MRPATRLSKWILATTLRSGWGKVWMLREALEAEKSSLAAPARW
jgi:hypothetical protein